jgi:hypothetical protein
MSGFVSFYKYLLMSIVCSSSLVYNENNVLHYSPPLKFGNENQVKMQLRQQNEHYEAIEIL